MRIYVRGPSLGPIHTTLWSSKPRRKPTAREVAARQAARQRAIIARAQAATSRRNGAALAASLPAWPDQVDAKAGLLRKSHQASLTVEVDGTTVGVRCPHKHSSADAATACGEAMSALVYASLQGHDAPREHFFACENRSHRHHTANDALWCIAG